MSVSPGSGMTKAARVGAVAMRELMAAMGAAATWVVVVVAGVCAALFGARTKRLALYGAGKAVASLGFVAAAIASGATSSAWGSIALAALAIAAAGDIVLALPGPRALLGGLAVFAVAHLTFTVAFAVRGVGAWPGTALAGVLAVGVVVLVWRWLRTHLRGEWRGAVALYLVVVAVMLCSGIASALHAASPLMALGIGLIAGSDVAVARHAFVEKSFLNKVWGLPVYYLGMVLIALSLGV